MKQNKFKTFLSALTLCLFFALPAAAQYATTDFLISDFSGSRIAVYNQNLVFQRYLATGFQFVVGLDLLPNGNVAGAGRSPSQIRVYNPAGTLVTSFTNANIDSPIDLKVSTAGLFYVGTQATPPSVAEFTAAGTYNRSFGSKPYDGVVVFGNTLWAGGDAQPGIVDVYDITTGLLTSTITLDNGQSNAESMYYSRSTNTILMVDSVNSKIYERTTTGAYVRQFTGGGSVSFGVTRGPGGDVFATAGTTVSRWTAAGVFVSTTNLSPNLSSALGIIWAGASVVTAATATVSGQVITPENLGLTNALVTLTDSQGSSRTVMTGKFGNFRFNDVASGETYIITVQSKRYTYAPQVISVSENLAGIVLNPQ